PAIIQPISLKAYPWRLSSVAPRTGHALRHCPFVETVSSKTSLFPEDSSASEKKHAFLDPRGWSFFLGPPFMIQNPPKQEITHHQPCFRIWRLVAKMHSKPFLTTR